MCLFCCTEFVSIIAKICQTLYSSLLVDATERETGILHIKSLEIPSCQNLSLGINDQLLFFFCLNSMLVSLSNYSDYSYCNALCRTFFITL